MRVRIIGLETILWVDSFLMMTVPATTKVRVYRVLQVSWRGWPSSTWPGCRLVGDTPAHSATPTLGRGWSESEVSLPVFRSRVFFLNGTGSAQKSCVPDPGFSLIRILTFKTRISPFFCFNSTSNNEY